jgi:hypothetical protein
MSVATELLLPSSPNHFRKISMEFVKLLLLTMLLLASSYFTTVLHTVSYSVIHHTVPCPLQKVFKHVKK